MTELNDQSLLSHWYRHRNAEAFRVLATRHARMVYATALRILRNAHDAEEVAQQSFLALAQTRRPPSGNVAAWLHRTAYRAALNLTRARNRRTARDHAYAAAQPESTRIEWDDIRDLVDEAVAGLPDASRECIVLYFFEEQTHAAIGERLGITRQAVAQRIEKGIALVRKRLASKGVVVPAGAALVALIHENSAHALPATLTAELGRIALAGTPSLWAVGATYVSGLAFKMAATMVVLAAIGWAIAHQIGREPGDSPIATAVAAADTSDSDAQIGAGDVEAVIRSAAGMEPAPPDTNAVFTSAAESGDTQEESSDLAYVAGVVTLPNGKPFPDANVMLIIVDVLGDHRFPEGTLFRLKTDARGAFEQPDMPPAEYSVMVTEPADSSWGKGNEFLRILLGPGERKNGLNLVFGTEGNLTVSGTVVDGDGRPIEGVRAYKFGPVPRAAMTDAQGRFTLRFLPDDDIRISLEKEGYSQAGTTVPAGTQDVLMTMYGNGAIAGRVIDAKTRKPVPQFEVSYMNGHWPAFNESLFGNGKQCDEAEGKFDFPDVYVGEVTVAARAPGYAPAMAQILVESKQTLRDLTLELGQLKSVVLSGRVEAEDGSPIAGARIYTDRIAPPDDRLRNVVATTDTRGVFTLEDARPDTPFIAAWHPNYAPGSSRVTGDTIIILKRAARLNVEVLSQGQPMPRVGVRVYFLDTPNVGYIAGGITGADGRLLVEEVVPGEVAVETQLPLSRTQQKILTFAPGEERSIQFEVHTGDAAVEGTVLNGGATVGGGEVSLYVEAETGPELFKKPIAADGTFQIRDVPTGTAQLVAVAEDYVSRARVDDVPIVPGETTVLTVDVTPSRRVSGNVRGLHAGDTAMLRILYGAMDTREAINTAIQSWFGPDILGVGATDGTTDYEISLHEQGTYTLVLSTSPAGNYSDNNYHESRIVEVKADEDLAVDFELNY